MPFFDLPRHELETYSAPDSEPADFDAFWASTLAEARAYGLSPVFTPYEARLKLVDAYDVTFSGYGGQRIKGWYLRPAGVASALPCIVEYIGYGGGRGYPHSWLAWPAAGYALLVMDTRGQGSAWRRGDTPDLPPGDNPHIPGYMTQGILDPVNYYYRRVYVDAVRAVEAALSRADVDSSRVAVTGGSQGGGLSIAAAALIPDAVNVCMPDVPFLCHFRRAVGLTDAYPYQEIVNYLHTHRDKTETVFRTLSYFDGIHLARRIRGASLFSTGLMDTICPPSTVFAAYNALPGKKAITVYEFNQHEGGEEVQWLEKVRFLASHWEG